MPLPAGIRGELLDLICECARDQHPYEFAAVMRQEGDTITELLPVPGGIAGDEHAILPLHMLPIDWSICGVVHSHPSPTTAGRMRICTCSRSSAPSTSSVHIPTTAVPGRPITSGVSR